MAGDFGDSDFISFSAEKEKDEEEEELEDENESMSENEVVPWMREQTSMDSPLISLHNEILSLCDLLLPTAAEKEARQDVVEWITEFITEKVWPKEEEVCVSVFGSELTKLALPASDVDLVVLGLGARETMGKKHLFKLEAALRESGQVDFIEVVSKARIPLVKVRHEETKVHLDISFGQPGGLETGALVNKFLSHLPPMRPLILVLKLFMVQRQLNETFLGGVGSFLLQLMTISFLQHHNTRSMHQQAQNPSQHAKRHHHNRRYQETQGVQNNLGSLLLDWLELYGRKFSYERVGISIRNNGSYFPKRTRGWLNFNRQYLLSMENPMDTSIDIGRNSYNISQIVEVFGHAHDRLVAQLHAASKWKEGHTRSILAVILNPQDPMLADRHLPLKHVFNTWIDPHHTASGEHSSNPSGTSRVRSRLKLPPPSSSGEAQAIKSQGSAQGGPAKKKKPRKKTVHQQEQQLKKKKAKRNKKNKKEKKRLSAGYPVESRPSPSKKQRAANSK